MASRASLPSPMHVVVSSVALFLRDRSNRWQPLSFDESADVALTGAPDFHGDRRHLQFCVEISTAEFGGEPPPEELCVYLGEGLDSCDEALVIPLGEPIVEGDRVRYESAPYPPAYERKKGVRTKAMSFATSFWTVGRAGLTVCLAPQGDSPLLFPLLRLNGGYFKTAVRLDYPDPSYREMYLSIRGDVQSAGSAANMSSPIRDSLEFDRQGEVESPILSLYNRLYGCLRDLSDTLEAIAIAPVAELVLERQTVRASPVDAPRAMATVASSTLHPTVLAAVQGPRGLVPTLVSGFAPTRTKETEANRYAGWALEQILFWIRDIDQDFSEYISQQVARVSEIKKAVYFSSSKPKKSELQKAVDRVVDAHVTSQRELRDEQVRLERLRSALPEPEAWTVRTPSSTVTFEPRYAQLQHLVRQFNSELYVARVPGGSDLIETNIEPFSELFEIWSFQRIVDALLSLGFEEVPDSSGRASDRGYVKVPIYQNPRKGSSVAYSHPERLPLGGEVRLHFGKLYPRYDGGSQSAYGVETRSWRTDTHKRKGAPDTSIECFLPGRDLPAIMVLDASLAASQARDKALYKKTIRGFYEDEVGDYETFSKRVVAGAYCVSPLPSNSPKAASGWLGLSNGSQPSPLDRLTRQGDGALEVPVDRDEAVARISDLIRSRFEKVGIWCPLSKGEAVGKP